MTAAAWRTYGRPFVGQIPEGALVSVRSCLREVRSASSSASLARPRRCRRYAVQGVRFARVAGRARPTRDDREMERLTSAQAAGAAKLRESERLTWLAHGKRVLKRPGGGWGRRCCHAARCLPGPVAAPHRYRRAAPTPASLRGLRLSVRNATRAPMPARLPAHFRVGTPSRIDSAGTRVAWATSVAGITSSMRYRATAMSSCISSSTLAALRVDAERLDCEFARVVAWSRRRGWLIAPCA